MDDNEPANNEVVTVSLDDILKDDDELAILGGTKPNDTCTYVKGYVKRQAIYVCQTCTSGDSLAGICFHCAAVCHDGHDVLEMLTKRNFRCDCGNEKFPTSPCLLIAEKDDTNSANKYNHNFKGRYCVCDQLEDETKDTMYQCCICEDWFHEKCIFPESDFKWFTQYSKHLEDNEIACQECVAKLPHLATLATTLSVRPLVNISPEALPLNGEPQDAPPFPTEVQPSPSTVVCLSAKDLEAPETKRQRTSSQSAAASVVWLHGWRECICKCEECKKLLEQSGLLFLLDPEDTQAHYCEVAKNVAKEMNENALQDLLNHKDVITRNVVLQGINKLSDAFTKLRDNLQKEGKGTENNPVSREDVMKVFGSLLQNRNMGSHDDSDGEIVNQGPGPSSSA